jgi:hypothetical protein
MPGDTCPGGGLTTSVADTGERDMVGPGRAYPSRNR